MHLEDQWLHIFGRNSISDPQSSDFFPGGSTQGRTVGEEVCEYYQVGRLRENLDTIGGGQLPPPHVSWARFRGSTLYRIPQPWRSSPWVTQICLCYFHERLLEQWRLPDTRQSP